MSDLIDFDSPNPRNEGPSLASPLIPAPKIVVNNDGSNLNEAGLRFLVDNRRSFENNPFDMIMKQVTEYEKNKEDPFEKVIEKAMGSGKSSPVDSTGHVEAKVVCKHESTRENNDLVQEEGEISIITDLDNTNLIADHDKKALGTELNCDNKIPNIHVSPASCKTDLSILSISAMDDSLLECDSNPKEENKSSETCLAEARSVPQIDKLALNHLSIKVNNKRSASLTDSLLNGTSGENSSLYQSNIIENPLNNAFIKSNLSSQLNLSVNKLRTERINSDSSMYSGVSNLSNIPMDSSSRMRHERFCSDSSVISGISNLSIIPTNVESSSDLSVFSNDTMNKAFVTSRLQLYSASFSASENTSHKSDDKSDLIKKYQELKKRMSTQVEFSKNEDNIDSMQDKKVVLPPSTHPEEKENPQSSIEKLVDINNSSNSVFSDDTNVNDIIANEAKSLAEMLDKLSSSKVSNSSTDDNLLFSKTQLNFDDLPLSDDEVVDNLIDLPSTASQESVSAQNYEWNVCKSDNIKLLENELIEDKNLTKKQAAATLLFDLQKIINKENNMDACKVLDDLKKVLGVEPENNTQLLQNYLQNPNVATEEESQLKTSESLENHVPELNRSLENKNKENVSKLKNTVDNTKDSTDENTQINFEGKSDTKITKNVEVKDEPLNDESQSVSAENDLEDQKLAKTLLSTLNKIVNKKDENNVVDFLSSLGSILNMATELRTKNKQIVGLHEVKEKTSGEVPQSSNISSTPNNVKCAKEKQQNQSFEVPSKRKSGIIDHTSKTNNAPIPNAKTKRNSHLISMKRFSSNPELIDKKKNENSTISADKKSSLVTNSTTSESIKAKFKKKINSEIVAKKGPLKAMIPLGSMQKQASLEQASPPISVTPPKSKSISLTIPSSTPNSGRGYKISKSTPKASSTPNGEETKRLPKLPMRKDFKSTSEDNLSCMSLNSSLKRRTNTFIPNKRMDRTLSPQRKPQTPKRNSPNGSESRLPRYSPRAGRVRNYSFGDLRTTAKSPTKIGTPKFLPDKKLQRQSVLSPLRNSNKLEQGRPTNLISRFGRSSIPTGPEKENYA